MGNSINLQKMEKSTPLEHTLKVVRKENVVLGLEVPLDVQKRSYLLGYEVNTSDDLSQ